MAFSRSENKRVFSTDVTKLKCATCSGPTHRRRLTIGIVGDDSVGLRKSLFQATEQAHTIVCSRENFKEALQSHHRLFKLVCTLGCRRLARLSRAKSQSINRQVRTSTAPPTRTAPARHDRVNWRARRPGL